MKQDPIVAIFLPQMDNITSIWKQDSGGGENISIKSDRTGKGGEKNNAPNKNHRPLSTRRREQNTDEGSIT